MRCCGRRQAAACNGLSSKISVVNRDIAMLQRGKDVRTRGVNLVIADMFDAGGLATPCFLSHAPPDGQQRSHAC